MALHVVKLMENHNICQVWSAIHMYSLQGTPGYVLGHHGIETVEEVCFVHVKRSQNHQYLCPAVAHHVSQVAGLAVVGYDQFHVLGSLLARWLVKRQLGWGGSISLLRGWCDQREVESERGALTTGLLTLGVDGVLALTVQGACPAA